MAKRITKRNILDQVGNVLSARSEYHAAVRDYPDNKEWKEQKARNWEYAWDKLGQMVEAAFGKRKSVLFEYDYNRKNKLEGCES